VGVRGKGPLPGSCGRQDLVAFSAFADGLKSFRCRVRLPIMRGMSERPHRAKPKIVASRGDPGRAPALEPHERERLLTALQTNVLPALEQTAKILSACGFQEVRVEQRGAMVSLCAGSEKPRVEARLRFQIHETFAKLVAREPVFWMFTVYCGNELTMGKAGRMISFDDLEVLAGIGKEFAAASLASWQRRAAGPPVKSYHLRPGPSGEWHLTREGSDYVLGVFESKAFAVEKSLKLAGRIAASLRIYRADGTVEYTHLPPSGC
jgi:hypothetical protein